VSNMEAQFVYGFNLALNKLHAAYSSMDLDETVSATELVVWYIEEKRGQRFGMWSKYETWCVENAFPCTIPSP
jgi:hypothetical protein